MRKDALDLINRLQEKDETRHKVFETKCEELEIAKAENERFKNSLAISQKETKRFQESYKIAKKESTKNHKELLKSKVFKYMRNPNRIYTIMDFQDGEILRFYDYPEQPNALASGHYKFQGKNDIRLIHISEVKELSYEEIKVEAYKEFAEELLETKFKHGNDYIIYAENIYTILKEKVGDNNES